MGNVLATYTYAAGNGKLTRMTYGNGEYEDYTYDNLDRLVKVTYNGSAENAFTVLYDSNGRLAKAVDGKVGITYLYEYDSLDRLIRAYQKDASGNTVYAVENSYDEYGRAKGSKIAAGTTAHNYGVSYVEGTNLLDSYTMPNGKVHDYSYDKFDRLTWKSHFSNSFWTQYAYYKNGNNTTPLISTFEFCDGNCNYETYTYTYDALGNITDIRKNGSLVCSYEYDALGQLTRENNAAANFSVLYGYDKSGNITWRSEFPYSTGVLSAPAGDLTLYTYGNSQWKDLLTNYDGTNISYDAIGNPTNWVGIVGIEWNGRQLTYLTKDGLDHGVSFTYNADGIRTKKVLYDYDGTVTTHNYVLDGTNIIKETITSGSNTDILEYYYDEAGIAGFVYNGTKYYYVKNIQGDVIEICNTYGISVVSYTYDAWGNILSITGELASTVGQINSFRYRGYYYDSETGFYYVSSRYYDPEIGRWINADSVVAGIGENLLGYNMFAYCFNNPVNMTDNSGHWPQWIKDAVDRVNDKVIQPVVSFVKDIAEDINNFDSNNESEEKVLESNYFSSYKGVPVIRTNGDRSGSFGAIFLTRETNNRSNPEDVIRHEYGHTKQLEQLGIVNYALCIGLPSWQQWGTGEYYSKPWEITADVYGGVQSRKHSQSNIDRGFVYLEGSKIIGPLIWVFIE